MNQSHQLKVLFAASELASLAKVGGLGDVVESLPKALLKRGVDVRIVIPRYEQISTDGCKKILDLPVAFGGVSEHVTAFETVVPSTEVPLYLLENERFLSRGGIYFDRSAFVGTFSEIERFLFFSVACAEFLNSGVLRPDIVHCHDWHTGYLINLLRHRAPARKSVFTIHNLGNQGAWNIHETAEFLFGSRDNVGDLTMFPNYNTNLIGEGITHCDILTTVSSQYAKEITTEAFGAGLEDIIKKKNPAGILNGIDTEFFNPKTNKYLVRNFSADDPAGKNDNKRALQTEMKLAQSDHVPLLCVVSRLTEQKGVDLIVAAAKKLLAAHACQFVVLGRGDERMEDALWQLSEEHPAAMAVKTEFDEALANRIYAGADMMLIPSLFEPCGLTQMIASAYGTIPIVRKVGGLADTIFEYDMKTGAGNGFMFEKYDAEEFLSAIERGILLFHNEKSAWQTLMQNAMRKDFSWDKSAQEYVKMYEKLIQ